MSAGQLALDASQAQLAREVVRRLQAWKAKPTQMAWNALCDALAAYERAEVGQP